MPLTILRDLLYPALCTTCSRPVAFEQALCRLCLPTIVPVVSHYLKLSTTYTMTIHAVGAYQAPLETLVLQKFGGTTRGSMLLAHLIANHTTISPQDYDLLVPVPLHWTRYAKRGFNQADVIARHLGNLWQLPVAPAVKRSVQTEFQAQLDAAARHTNVAHAFTRSRSSWFGHPPSVYNKRILLVDDLCTTGATLSSIAHTLLPERPLVIDAVVGCRAV